MDHEIAFSSAKRLAARIRRRSIGCLELLDLYLDRVGHFNSALNAIVAMDIETARKRAKSADRAMRSGRKLGVLHGLPMTVKESFDVVGMPTTWGLEHLKSNFPARNALAVERLGAAGANIFGKTNVPVMLADWQTFNPVYGTTNNPWDLTRTPGGSSGGAAAALAAGLTTLELGSDIGASIRNPAHYCGVYGHKPTSGICAADGHNLPGITTHKDIAVIGPLTRHAEDLALALSVVTGPSLLDSRAWQLNLPRCAKTHLREFRVGVMLSADTAPVDQEVQVTIQRLADFLGAKGAHVADSTPAFNMNEAHRVFIQLLRSATSSSLNEKEFRQACNAAQTATLGSEDYYQWMVKAQCLSHREWLAWNEKRHQIAAAWEDYFSEFDVLLCPVAATAAFHHNHKGDRWTRMISVSGTPQPSTTQMFWAGLSGMAYMPSTVAPVGRGDSGLPHGVQIIGPKFADLTCIRFAELLAKEYCAFVPPPSY